MKQVVAALLVVEDRVLIAQRAAEDPLAGFWEFPGGKVEAGETPEASLAREMHEEFLVAVQIGEYFATSTYDYGHGVLELHAYWATWIAGEIDPQVHTRTAWVTPPELDTFQLLPADVPIAKKLQQLVLERRRDLGVLVGVAESDV